MAPVASLQLQNSMDTSLLCPEWMSLFLYSPTSHRETAALESCPIRLFSLMIAQEPASTAACVPSPF